MNFVNSSSPTGYHIGQLLGFESPSVVGGFPMVYEQDISPSLCPFGWTYYQDNGTEGTDSCLYIPRSGSTGLYSTSWISASRVCPVGSHLLSVRSSSVTSGLLPFATSLTPDPMFLGCYENGSNWYWFDGTSRNNVDASACGLSPCPLWLVVTTQ